MFTPSGYQNIGIRKLEFPGSNMFFLKGVFAKNERGYRLNAIKKRF